MSNTVALFPLPQSVVFPLQKGRYHIFEPRYRSMVEYCLAKNIWLGVCTPKKIIRNLKRQGSLKKALSTNNGLFEPQSIFSIGPVELLKEYSDGRYLIDVEFKRRVEIVEIHQQLPFYIVGVQEKETLNPSPESAQFLYFRLVSLLKALFGDQYLTLVEQFLEAFRLSDLETLLAKFFELKILPTYMLQECLEIDDLEKRALKVIGALEKIVPKDSKAEIISLHKGPL